MPPRIPVSESSFRKGAAAFRAADDVEFVSLAADEAALVAELEASGARAAVIGAQRVGAAIYALLARNAAGQPALLARFGVGHDNIDKPLAGRLGIIVTNTPGALTDSVAEHALWLLGNLAKHVGYHDRLMRRGAWAASTGIELRGKLLAIVGFGAIGQRVSAAAHFGLGMRVVAVGGRSAAEFGRSQGRPVPEIMARAGAEEYTADLDDALRRADAVSLHAPATAATRHLIEGRRLGIMRPESLLVNTARGALIDEAALYDALAGGRLAGAALDVFENEPYRPVEGSKDLRTLGNILLTPHVASNTHEANARMAKSVIETVRNFLAGRVAELPAVR